MSNVGEIDEPLIIKTLVDLKGKDTRLFGRITSVRDYNGNEIPAGIRSDDIPKAPAHAKRDVTVNGKSYSIKSIRNAPVAIVNHTTREKWIRVCGDVGLTIAPLDSMVKEYWNLRKNREIGEDVWTRDNKCPFGKTPEDKEYLKKLINYFLFDGTGTRKSEFPADCILEASDPVDIAQWAIYDRNRAFDLMWPRTKFSIRAKKGMPTDYPNMRDRQKMAVIDVWVVKMQDEYRGALHVRTE